MQSPHTRSDGSDAEMELENATVIEGSDLEDPSVEPQSWGTLNAENRALGYYTSSSNWSVPGSAASSYNSSQIHYGRHESVGSIHSVAGSMHSVHNSAIPPSVPGHIGGHGGVPQSAPGSVSAGGFAGHIPNSIPGSIPGSVPGSIPGSVAGSVPSGMPGMLPGMGMMPGSLQGAMHAGIMGAVPGSVPGSIPGAIPGTLPAHMPGGLPGSTPGSVTGSIPGTLPDTVSGSASKASSYYAPMHNHGMDTYSNVSSVSSRFMPPPGQGTGSVGSSYVAPSQIERSRNYSHWPSSSHHSFAASPPSDTSPALRPQRSLLSSMIAQSRRGSTPVAMDHQHFIPQRAVSTTNVSATSVATATGRQIFRHETPPVGGPEGLQLPAEPTLEGRRSIDATWQHETTASPPRTQNFSEKFSPSILSSLPCPTRTRTFHFQGCDTSQVLAMITSALQQIINTNDKLYPSEGDRQMPKLPEPASPDGQLFKSTLLGFHGCNVPGIGLDAYLARILKYCPTTADVFLALLVYLDRMKTIGQRLSAEEGKSLFVLDSYNVHRLMIAGMTVASKFFSDIFYKNSRYAKVGGLPVDELNHLELQFLLLLDFRLMVSVEELQVYADFLLNSEPGASTTQV